MTAFYFNYSGWRCVVRSFRAVFVTLCSLLIFSNFANVGAQVLGDPVDVSQDFQKLENVYFVGSKVSDFDAKSGSGNLVWDRYLRSTTLSFNKIDAGLIKGKAKRISRARNMTKIRVCRFRFRLCSIRARFVLDLIRGQTDFDDGNPSLMLDGVPKKDNSWKVSNKTDK